MVVGTPALKLCQQWQQPAPFRRPSFGERAFLCLRGSSGGTIATAGPFLVGVKSQREYK
jgi:hypothetical protein